MSRRQTPRTIKVTLLSQASSDGWRHSANHYALLLVPRQWMRDLCWTNENLERYLCLCLGSSFSFVSPTTLHLKPQIHSFSLSKQTTWCTHARARAHTHTPSQAFSLNICYHLSVNDFLQFGYKFNNISEWRRSRDSSVGTVTRYGLDGPRIESRWGRDFPHPSRPSLRPTQPPIQ
jgi:hypothetical protein